MSISDHAPVHARMAYFGGTKRSVSPETTFARIQPLLDTYGITRLADITGLDSLGVPVYVAVRPRGRLLQASQGKGARAIDAKVSALMEAMELAFAEAPTQPFLYASAEQLQRAGRAYLDPTAMEELEVSTGWSEKLMTSWVEGKDLLDGTDCLLPASAVYFISPYLIETSSNGLASGNDEAEATLHALYEIYERDASCLLVDDDNRITFDACDVIALDTIDNPILLATLDRFRSAGVQLKLFRIAVDSPLHTFYAVLLDDSAFAVSSVVAWGLGTHLSPVIAASRAITEAAQGRLTHIHAARDDIPHSIYREHRGESGTALFAAEEDTPWSDLQDSSTETIAGDLELVLAQWRKEGATQVLRHTLTPPGFAIAVVKVIVPGASIDEFFL